MFCMAHITLSVPDEIYAEMKNHPEIKWSEVARQNIITKVLSLKKVMSSREFFSLLDEKTQQSIKNTSDDEWKEFSLKMEKKGWMRKKYLTQA